MFERWALQLQHENGCLLLSVASKLMLRMTHELATIKLSNTKARGKFATVPAIPAPRLLLHESMYSCYLTLLLLTRTVQYTTANKIPIANLKLTVPYLSHISRSHRNMHDKLPAERPSKLFRLPQNHSTQDPGTLNLGKTRNPLNWRP